jgi:hypothetical protein
MNNEIVIRSYIKDCRPNLVKDLDYYKAMPSLFEAISMAALALNHKGKRHNHQRRLKSSTLLLVKEKLLNEYYAIQIAKDFDTLYDIVKSARVTGYGELAIYDAALRLGAFLNIFPTEVYLHAGTTIGAKKLLSNKPSKHTIKIENLPEEFHPLTAYEIEDLLCIFKDRLK